MRLELDLDRWERGDLSAHELVARHGRDEVEGLIAVHARLEDVGAASTPDPDVSWQAFRWQLPTPRSRRRRGRVLALAAALAVGLASMGYAAERLWRPLTRPPAFDLRPPASPSVGASTTPQDPYLFPRPVEDQDEPGDSNGPDGGTDSSDSGTSGGEPGNGGGGSRSEKGGSDDDADEDEDEDQDDDEEEDEHEDERGEDDEDHADADEVDDEGKDDD